MADTTTLTLAEEWDKTFPKSEQVNHRKVTFRNRYGITLAADLYEPKNAAGRLAAIAVCGPFGAVKEQASGLYARDDGGMGIPDPRLRPVLHRRERRRTALMCLTGHQYRGLPGGRRLPVRAGERGSERIGIIGICGWGGMALNAAAWTPASRRPWRPPCTT